MSTLSEETLYRAALTCCMDSADAMMYASLKGAGSAKMLWTTLLNAREGQTCQRSARSALERMSAQGLTRCGYKASARAMEALHTSLNSWLSRMKRLPSLDMAQLEDWLTNKGEFWIISPADSYWPLQLDDLATRSDWAPPLCLWGQGDPQALISCSHPIGIVGSRDANEYGRYVAHTIAEQAAARGHLVVSGGAMGIDAAAHWGALSAREGRNERSVGRTVAVFAGGLNHIGPGRNSELFARMKEHGCALISELPPHVIPEARRFLLRNRIIAALSSTVVVAQARLRSGALNTARWACDLMREIYAIPGDITQSNNAGCNQLISNQQAIMLCSTSAQEHITHEEHLPILRARTEESTPAQALSESQSEQAEHNLVIAALRTCKKRHLIATPDALLKVARATNPDVNIGQILQALGELELLGAITRQNGTVCLT